MALKWTMKRSTTIPGDENIGVTTTDLIVEFETGSLKEAYGFMQEQDTVIGQIFGFSPVARVDFSAEEKGEIVAEPTRRARGPNKPKPEAVAPAPLPVPTEAPAAPSTTLPPNALPTTAAPPSLVIPADGGIPPFLARPAATAPPALPSPPLAPLPPTAPPVGVLGPKVIAALERHKDGKPDGGQALADWLASAGLTIKGATFDDACRVLLMTSDEKITAAGILAPLGVAA